MKINFSSPITLWLCFLSFVGFFLVQVEVLTNFFILKGNFLENSNTWFLSCAGYIFGHASFSHFFGNVSILLLLGPIVEERFGSKLLECGDTQIKSVFDDIAFNDNTDENLQEAIRLFAVYRGMIITGYFTSEVGIKDLEYKGNTPNIWDGVPDEILKDYSVSYDEEWISRCVDQSKRNDLAEWDEDGNLLT